MSILKQSTNYTRDFLMVLSSDHITGATGKTVTIVISKAGGVFASPTGTVTEIANGWYFITLAVADVNTIGDLAFHATASGCDPTDWVDQVQSQIFTDLQLSNTGRALIANSVQQNAALNGFTFPMVSTTTGLRQTGLTVTAQRTLGGGGFAPCANAVTEIGTTGIYTINLATTDTNSPSVGILLTATGAADVYLPIYPTQ